MMDWPTRSEGALAFFEKNLVLHDMIEKNSSNVVMFRGMQRHISRICVIDKI